MALCEGNSSVPGGFSLKKVGHESSDVSFVDSLNNLLSRQCDLKRYVVSL